METREYRTINKTAWGDGPWLYEIDKRQWQDKATGLPCLIVRNPMGGNLCGYVGVPATHPAHGMGYSSWGYDGEGNEIALPSVKRVINSIEVHGGLTFDGQFDGLFNKRDGHCLCGRADGRRGVCQLGDAPREEDKGRTPKPVSDSDGAVKHDQRAYHQMVEANLENGISPYQLPTEAFSPSHMLHVASVRTSCDDVPRGMLTVSPGQETPGRTCSSISQDHYAKPEDRCCGNGAQVRHTRTDAPSERFDCTCWFLGFDCAHAWDVLPAMDARHPRSPSRNSDDEYRTVEYVARECASLARQLAPLEALKDAQHVAEIALGDRT